MAVTGYCVKCGVKGTPIKSPVISMTARGGYIAKGACTKCGTTVCAMMSQANADAAIKKGEAKKGY
jgi:hypothetical protein